ncbi:MAG: CBS domain-containing protein [archaeon GB-1867-005]|nr:CBS domain-containing protein [Candidatus Culexmicrobium cathedralense]
MKCKMRRIEPRFLRSDGKPNFSDKIYEREFELSVIVKKPVITASQRAPVKEVIQMMVSHGFRRVPITMPDKRLLGIVTATDLVNYFGGGDYFNIIVNRHEGNLYKAVEEPIESIMVRNVVKAYIDETFVDVLERMVVNNVGAVPIVDEDEKVFGIITERDVLRYLANKVTGKKVKDIMTKDVVTASPETTVKEASQTMINLGFRRLPVIVDDKLVGIVVAMDIVKLFQLKRAIQLSPKCSIYDLIRIPISNIMSSPVITISPDAELGEATKIMSERRIGALPVVENNELVGILTERDMVYDLVLAEYR